MKRLTDKEYFFYVMEYWYYLLHVPSPFKEEGFQKIHGKVIWETPENENWYNKDFN